MKKLLLGLVSAILPHLDLEQLLQYCKERGMRSVEVLCWPVGAGADRKYAGVSHFDVVRVVEDPEYAAEIKRLMDESGLRIVLGYYPNVMQSDYVERSKCLQHLGYVILAAEVLGIRVVSTFAGKDQNRSVEEQWDELIQIWKEMAELAAEREVCLAFEGCPMRFGADQRPYGQNILTGPALWEKFISDVDSPNIGLTVDPAHLAQQLISLKVLRRFVKWILHVHVKNWAYEQRLLDEHGIYADPLQVGRPVLPCNHDGWVDMSVFFRMMGEIADELGVDLTFCLELEEEERSGDWDGAVDECVRFCIERGVDLAETPCPPCLA